MQKALFGLTSVLLVAVASLGTTRASTVTTHNVTVTGATGDLSFVVPTHNGFSSDTVQLGSDVVNIRNMAFNPALGSLLGGIATLGFTGDTFKVVYGVEGFGNEMVFSDTVSVTVSTLLNGALFGTPEMFTTSVNGSCGSPSDDDVDRFCTAKALLEAFSGSQSVVLPSGTNASSLKFVYDVTQSDEHCVGNFYTDGVITNTTACIQGGTSIVDTSDLFDPAWSANASITYTYKAPEPAGIALLSLGLGCLAIARRRRSA